MITSAACKAVVNGEENIFPVMRHSHFYEWMKLLHCNYNKNEVEQGFIDWTDEVARFVSRQEAAQIAIKCNQILPSMKKNFNPNCLYSEDIY